MDSLYEEKNYPTWEMMEPGSSPQIHVNMLKCSQTRLTTDTLTKVSSGEGEGKDYGDCDPGSTSDPDDKQISKDIVKIESKSCTDASDILSFSPLKLITIDEYIKYRLELLRAETEILIKMLEASGNGSKRSPNETIESKIKLPSYEAQFTRKYGGKFKRETLDRTEEMFAYSFFGRGHNKLAGNSIELAIPSGYMKKEFILDGPKVMAFYRAAYSTILIDNISEDEADKCLPGGEHEIVSTDEIIQILVSFCEMRNISVSISGDKVLFYWSSSGMKQDSLL